MTVQDPHDPDLDEGYSGKQVCRIVGITYRQLDYWARTDLVRPSIRDAQGSGSQRRYGYRDLLTLKVIKTLLDAGMKLQSVRVAVDYLREELSEDLVAANLVLDGSTPVLIRNDGEMIDLLRKGQGVLNVLPLSGIVAEVDDAITELRPARESRDGEGGREAGPASADAHG